ncbi:MAG: PLP-dependent aminotransferase family protein [Clostridiales bacterium]|nr:PLP-dependent aminotransferase family protein [Clostridiales bacterium]
MTSRLPAHPPKLIFTTPSHQFPTGVVLPAKRRIELLQYAREQNAYVVEDDYDSEFNFDGSPITSMQFLDPEHVIYVGTFSKTFMPSLRIGYMVLPDSLCEQMGNIKYVADLHSPILEQLAMAAFLESGQFERQIRRMGKLYRRKRDLLIQCLKETFGEQIEFMGANSGLHFVAKFPSVTITEEQIKVLADLGVEIGTIKKHYARITTKELTDHGLLMGYGNLHMEDIEEGVSILAKVLK